MRNSAKLVLWTTVVALLLCFSAGSASALVAGCSSDAECDDGNPCTRNVCTDGQCEFPGYCDDGDPCTDEYCSDFGGVPSCFGPFPICDDFNACTDDVCDPQTTQCTNTLKNPLPDYCGCCQSGGRPESFVLPGGELCTITDPGNCSESQNLAKGFFANRFFADATCDPQQGCVLDQPACCGGIAVGSCAAVSCGVASCTGDGDCMPGEYCDAFYCGGYCATKTCGAPCSTNSDCAGSEFCDQYAQVCSRPAGTCVPPPVQCSETLCLGAPCPEGQYCNFSSCGGYCVDGPSPCGQSCLTDSDCGPGEKCDGIDCNSQCRAVGGEVCLRNTDCGPGLECSLTSENERCLQTTHPYKCSLLGGYAEINAICDPIDWICRTGDVLCDYDAPCEGHAQCPTEQRCLFVECGGHCGSFTPPPPPPPVAACCECPGPIKEECNFSSTCEIDEQCPSGEICACDGYCLRQIQPFDGACFDTANSAVCEAMGCTAVIGNCDPSSEHCIGGTCGDELCELGESCESCPSDCGPCTPVCGDNVCDGSAGESCSTCPADCGGCLCPAVPLIGCDEPHGFAVLAFWDWNDDKFDRFRLRLARNMPEHDLNVFGDPTVNTSISACIYNNNVLISEISLPAGARWHRYSSRFSYRDRLHPASGIKFARLRAGRAGRPRPATIRIRGQGAGLPNPTLPLSTPLNVVAQVVTSNTPFCFSETFDTAQYNHDGSVLNLTRLRELPGP